MNIYISPQTHCQIWLTHVDMMLATLPPPLRKAQYKQIKVFEIRNGFPKTLSGRDNVKYNLKMILKGKRGFGQGFPNWLNFSNMVR